MEPGEMPLDALIREVGSDEEEKTGKLAEEVRRQRPQPRRVEVGRQPHFIFEVLVTEDVAESLEAGSEESYGLELVKAENLDTDEGLASFSSELTPKTLAIYRAMGRPV